MKKKTLKGWNVSVDAKQKKKWLMNIMFWVDNLRDVLSVDDNIE